MKKKKVEVEEVVAPTIFVDLIVEKPKLSKIEVDFGREDLNALRSKVNEIVERLNA